MRDIGKNIKELRQLKNLTQDQLAEKLFVTRQTVSNYETGKSRPDVDMLAQIAETLDADLNAVIYGLPQPRQDRKRKLLKLGLTVVCLVVVWLGCGFLATRASAYEDRFFLEQRLFYMIGARPLLAFMICWTAMQTLGTFAGLNPLREPWAKGLRWTVAVLEALYTLLMLSVFSPLGQYLPKALIFGKTAYWILGYLSPNPMLRPCMLLFGVLGCALWLGMPTKPKQ